MSWGPQVFSDRAGAKERQRLVFALIAAASEPVTIKYIFERLRTKMTRGQVDSAVYCMREHGQIEMVTPAHGGHSFATWRAVATERKAG